MSSITLPSASCSRTTVHRRRECTVIRDADNGRQLHNATKAYHNNEVLDLDDYEVALELVPANSVNCVFVGTENNQ